MRNRRPNYRLVKIHRTYRVDEIARLFGFHRNTVRDWIKRGGLKTIDDRRPVLILGSELIAFLQARRLKNKRPCGPGEIYCVRCRLPRVPAGMAAEYRAMTGSVGNLAALCPVCDSTMFRRVRHVDLPTLFASLAIRPTEREPRIDKLGAPSVNSDFEFKGMR